MPADQTVLKESKLEGGSFPSRSYQRKIHQWSYMVLYSAIALLEWELGERKHSRREEKSVSDFCPGEKILLFLHSEEPNSMYTTEFSHRKLFFSCSQCP